MNKNYQWNEELIKIFQKNSKKLIKRSNNIPNK